MHPSDVGVNVDGATSVLDRPTSDVDRNASIACAAHSTKQRHGQSATIGTMHRRRCRANTTTLHAFVVSAPTSFGWRLASFSSYTGYRFESIGTNVPEHSL